MHISQQQLRYRLSRLAHNFNKLIAMSAESYCFLAVCDSQTYSIHVAFWHTKEGIQMCIITGLILISLDILNCKGILYIWKFKKHKRMPSICAKDNMIYRARYKCLTCSWNCFIAIPRSHHTRFIKNTTLNYLLLLLLSW